MVHHINSKITLMIEGPTASGKTTLAKILQQALHADLVSEPFDKWQDINSENLFETFRNNPSRWAYTFQSYVFVTEIEAFNQALKKGKAPLILSDRSLYSGLCVFTKMLYEEGMLTDLEWHLYKNVTNWLLSYFPIIPSAFVYLRTSPQICCERNSERNRPADSPLKLDYFVKEVNCNDDWLLYKKSMPHNLLNVPVLTLDGDRDFVNDSSRRDELIYAVQKFLTTIPT